ncbi:MAG: hypothetical protein DMG42_17815 [Acidobacteria bacterium]|nr:MAG: hypothetical protein DMG42_17815 [Acidobacteriota bacterium]
MVSRIHRLTLGELRKEIQSVTPAQFMNWLLRWQHLAPGTQLFGEHGTLEAVRQIGIVFRELLACESILPKWRELLMILRRLEDRGEVRGGRFVSGFLGEQFALPVAVESLRAMRHEQPSGETIPVSAADPMNLVGIVVPGERVPANSGKVVAFRGGVVVPNGERAAVIRMTASGSENAERWAFTMRISSAWKCVSRMEPHCFSA